MPAPLPSRFDADETQKHSRLIPPGLLADPALDDRPSDMTVMSAAELPSARFPPRPQIKRVRAPAFERASRVFSSAPPAVDTEPMLGADAPDPAGPAPSTSAAPRRATPLLAGLGSVLLLVVPLGAPRVVARWFPERAPTVTMASARAFSASARRPILLVGPLTAPAKTGRGRR